MKITTIRFSITIITIQLLFNASSAMECVEDKRFIDNYLEVIKDKKQERYVPKGEFIAEGGNGQVYKITWKGVEGDEDAQEAIVKISLNPKDDSLQVEANIMTAVEQIYKESFHTTKVFGCFRTQSGLALVAEYVPINVAPNYQKKEIAKNEAIHKNYVEFYN
jgi:hypothetical protein